MATFVVDGGSSGLERQPIPDKLGLHASDTAALFFDNVEVPADRLIGEVGDGFKIAQNSLESGRTSTAACAVGIIQACLDASVAYAQQREQWGKPIAGHQLIQEMVADMATDCEAARLLTIEAAKARDAGLPATRNVVMAKHFATEAAVRAARTAISLHGGVGYLGEYPVEGLLRDAIGLSLYEGTTQIQKLILGRELLGVSAF
jgi:alkylation response protein AidB-like acyl-CoA dehydrogenase